jgi:glutamate 5-kinase
LPAGIVRICGAFNRGDTVAIGDETGRAIARGITSYSSDALQQIRGCHSDEIADLLGYTYGPTVVHRNDMILLAEG